MTKLRNYAITKQNANLKRNEKNVKKYKNYKKMNLKFGLRYRSSLRFCFFFSLVKLN